MKKILLILLIALTTVVYSQTDSAYYYVDTFKTWYYPQKDMFSFKKIDGTAYTGILSSSIVDKLETSLSGINSVYFKNSATETDILNTISIIETDPLFYSSYPVITKEYLSNYTDEKHIITDDIICVVFNNPYITMTEVNNFAIRNNLSVYHTPVAGLPVGNRYTYLFKCNEVTIRSSRSFANSSVVKAANIYENESSIVKYAIPNFVTHFKPNSINDPEFNKMWYVKNTAQSIMCTSTNGNAGADTKMDRVWNDLNEYGSYTGYTGTGIEIGVIDFHDFDWGHQELNGQFLQGLNAIDGTPITSWISVDNLQSHGTAVSSLIVGKANNNYQVAGMAFGAKIRPYLIEGTDGSDVIAMQQALADGVNIINMSWGIRTSATTQAGLRLLYPILYNEILNCYNSNIVLIGSHGMGTGDGVTHFPADLDEVLSVNVTTPNDFKKEWGDGWVDALGDFGGDYGPFVDVAAPGFCLYAADNSTEEVGYNFDDFVDFSGSSAAAPLVSGLAALLLEKEPTLTNEEVYTAIKFGADKVGGYDYNYYPDFPGKSLEIGYGRINGYRTVFEVPNSIHSPTESNFDITYLNPISTFQQIKINLTDWKISIFDNKGILVYSNSIKDKITNFDLSYLSSGMYYMTIQDNNSKTNETYKLIKE